MKLGVAITVHNRVEVTDRTLENWRAMLPRDCPLIIVDDASDVPYPGATYRFEKNVGIARAKNKCLELLEDLGVTDAFLADSDVWPVSKDWWKPYVESPEPHLSYQFLDKRGPVKLHDMKVVYEDEKHYACTGQRGCILYYHLPTVLPQVGGFDPIFGRALFEHGDLANRIHSLGLTTFRYGDVVGSNKLWHSLDEHGGIRRTVRQDELQELYAANKKIFDSRQEVGYQGFVPYREDEEGVWDLVITTLLTTNPDPQRGVKWNPDPALLSPWLESMERGGWDGVVLADELEKLPRGYSTSKVVQVDSSTMNVYYQRWVHIYQFLRENPGIRWVWCTDGTDVEVLRDPFANMTIGKLYVGEENSSVGNTWMKEMHPSPKLQQFIQTNRLKPLVNAGVVGGDRNTVMELAHRIITCYEAIETERFQKRTRIKQDVGDMATFNLVVYEYFASRVHHGPDITTQFKANQDNGQAKFKHK